jgi:hypothetical protein
MKEMDFRMPFHSHDGEEWDLGGERERERERERRELEFKYLQRNWVIHIESDLLRSFHSSLEMRARFTSLIFLKPRPPKSLGKQRES